MPGTTSILYERSLPQGAVVRIRRVPPTAQGAVCAVIEVDRRAGTARESATDVPPALMAVEGATEAEVVASLLPFVEDDAAVARLLATSGIR
ncbi:MAG TPA: hypothetical protein VM820_09570 [Vicinamibacterales bacterium]|nr:hypothetical protein [Vicinamibacterales bacterium]